MASSTALTETEGPGRGMRRIAVRCGDVAFDVHPDRALDIGAFSFRGVPMAWMSPSGLVGPWNRDSTPMGWLRVFPGGLVSTCGLDAFGSPSRDEGEDYPLHGLAGTLQADQVGHGGRWTDDGDYEITVSGRVRQARLFGENLELRREIRCRLGTGELSIDDVVTNLGPAAQPQMILYHVNLGWPLLDEGATLRLPSAEVVPRDEDARAGVHEWDSFGPPTHPFPEQVFRHRLSAGSTEVRAVLSNPRLGLALAMTFDPRELPHLFQWKMLGSGAYVLGLEPANCPVIEGRATARSTGALPVLEPGESRHYRLTFQPTSA
ncbi:aldose 1-epimerase family protein [Blastococcus deserti]|uniref:Aldose 1-epimerase family protein n=1 Tax=Blastococcus deserti TaxID=2259033 RepID=A0ABW4XJH7_9ACTN